MTELLTGLRSLLLALLLFLSPATAEPVGVVDASRPSPPDEAVVVRAGLFGPHADQKDARGPKRPARRAHIRRVARSCGPGRAWTASPPPREGCFRNSRCGADGPPTGEQVNLMGRLRPRKGARTLLESHYVV